MEYIPLLIVVLLLLFIIFLFSIKMNDTNKQLVSCINRRFGCCNDNYTPKLDIFGSNCRGF